MNRYIAVILVIVVQSNAKQDFLFGKFPDGFEWGISSSEDFIENSKYNTYVNLAQISSLPCACYVTQDMHAAELD